MMFFRKTISKSRITSIHLNKHENHLTSLNEHLADKHPGLARLFNSNLCTISIVIDYLFDKKDSLIQQYLGRKLFDYEHNEVDFYLPQLLNMYIYIPSVAIVIHDYIIKRCIESVEFSLQCAWLLDAYLVNDMKISKTPNDAAKLLFDILYEKYQTKITNTLNAIESENMIIDEESKSDCSVLTKSSARQTRLTLGDLNSGRAFDNNCTCFENLSACQQQECICNSPRLTPEREFLSALINIGKKLPHVPTKDKKTQNLIIELKRMNMNLPARVWIPLYSHPHHVVRIVYNESTVLNSRDRSPYIIYIEIVLCNNIFVSSIPMKRNDSKLRSTKSEDDLFHFNQSNKLSNIETQSLNVDLVDSSRFYLNNEDADIWSVDEKIPVDDLQIKRNLFPINRSQQFMFNSNSSDSQSIHSSESSISLQEIIPANIRKKLNDAKVAGPILFERDPDDPSAATLKEPWDRKEQRIRQSSPYGHLRNWRLIAVIVKYGDDLRHELLAYQFMTKLKEIWQHEHVTVFVRPINILVLSNNSGLIEPILNAISFHQIKKHSKLSLKNYFLHEFGIETNEEHLTAVKNFVQSFAAYSIISYLLQLKDRHNGNILFDNQGHLIHIDFGYMLSSTPKNLGFENSPFKITQEFVEIMGGLESDMFKYYKLLLLKSLVAARKHMKQLISIVEIMQLGSQLNCFTKGDVIESLKERFHLNMTDEQLEFHVEKMIETSLNSWTTKVYDKFQYYTNGINN